LDSLKKTPLNSYHREVNAKMVPFGGWDMPVQYTGIVDEHLSTRTNAGIFDVSHMGEIFVEGKRDVLLPFIEKLTCNLVGGLKNGQVQYNAILNERGGLVDDVTIYKFHEEKYMICSNASNYENVFTHLLKYNPGIKITNQSSNWHQIALQGPKADEIFTKYLNISLADILYYSFKEIEFNGETIIVSRTGYTGEDGFEIYSTNDTGVKVWRELVDFGNKFGLKTVGLGARDTLRIEAKYPLYGHELSSIRSPAESGIGWIVKEKPIKFFQYEKIIEEKKNGSEVDIIAIYLDEPGVLREHFPIFLPNGKEVGTTTSGTFSPSLKKGIGLALVFKEEIKDSEHLLVEIRGERKKAVIQKGNFIQGSVKKNK
jgi:aminomethyltransferase